MACLAGCAGPEGSAQDHPVDLVLEETLTPGSSEVIDCRGGSITAATPPSDNDGLSVPEILIYLHNVIGVRIQNCTIEGSYPIFVHGGGFHRITGNTLRATGTSVYVASSDHNVIDHNASSSSEANVMVYGDSDDNVVWANDLTNEAGVEGGLGVGSYSYPGVENFSVNGQPRQLVTTSQSWPERLWVFDNTIHMEDGSDGVIAATRSHDMLVTGNDISGVEMGLGVAGWDDDAWFVDPGTCSGDPSFACDGGDPYFEDPDNDPTCNMPGVGDLGKCVGTQLVQGGGRVVSPTFVGNTISHAGFGMLSDWVGGDYVIEGNDFVDGTIGILITDYTIEQPGTIRGNVVRGNEIGLLIERYSYADIDHAGLDLSYNDFGDNLLAFDARVARYDPDFEVEGYTPYLLETSLPNNWWGGDGCGLPADESWPATTDPSPAAAPIAMAWRAGTADGVAHCP